MRVEITRGPYEDAMSIMRTTTSIDLESLEALVDRGGVGEDPRRVALAMLSWAPFIDEPGYFLLYLRALERVGPTIDRIYASVPFPSILYRYVAECPTPPSMIVIRNISDYDKDGWDPFEAYILRDDEYDPEIGDYLHGGRGPPKFVTVLNSVPDYNRRLALLRALFPSPAATPVENALVDDLTITAAPLLSQPGRRVVVVNTSDLAVAARDLADVTGWEGIELEGPESPFIKGPASLFVIGDDNRLLGYMTVMLDRRGGIALALIHRLAWAERDLGGAMLEALKALGRDIYLISEDDGSGKLNRFYREHGGVLLGGKEFIIRMR